MSAWGENWLLEAWPYLTKDSDGAIIFVRSSRNALWFDSVGGSYVARFGAKSTLSLDSVNDRLVLAQPSGEIWYFEPLDSGSSSSSSSAGSSAMPGMLLGMVDASGQVTDVTGYTTDGHIETIERQATVDSQTVTTQLNYTYSQGQITTVTHRQRTGTGAWNDIRRATYEYYDGTNNNGSAGDLMRVRVQEPDGTSWNNIRQSYYRYYKSGDTGGFQHGLRYVVEPDGYADMLDASLDPLTVSNTVLLQYAKYQFSYDSDHRVTQEVVDRGSLTFSFSYFTSSNSDDYNHWKTRTIETRPDGATRTVYANYLGQPLLSELKSGSDTWITADRYDSEAHRIESASPSAVASYNSGNADLGVQLNSTSGLIRLSNYYTTTSGSGAAKGYLESTSIKQGSSGTPILQSSFKYTTRSAGGATVYPVSEQVSYPNDDGTGALTTSYAYTWHAGTVQTEQQTATLPAVPTSENGSGTATSTKVTFDEYGNPTWTMDARGFITHTVYDIPTGAAVQRIIDADTSLLSGVPSGWATPSGGGKHLVYDYEIDDRGRTTQELGPEHTVDLAGTATTIRRATWTVYKDATHETWTAGGYATGSSPSYTYTLINPVTIVQSDPRGNQLAQITARRASTAGPLLPTDTFSQSAFQRWTTWQYTDCCLVSSMRVYHTIPASGEGTEGTNYDQTTYGYDSLKRRNREVSPGGTITRTVFDVRDQPVSRYVGTDDTGATASDPTGGGASGNNMVLVTAMQYDDGNDGGDGNLTRQTDHVDALNTRVTNYEYDWRNRRTATDGELDLYQTLSYDNFSRVTQTERRDTTSSGNVVRREESRYDTLGRVCQSLRYGVDPATGTVGSALTTDHWFDAAGNPVKTIAGGAGDQAFSKQTFDSLGRVTVRYSGYGSDASYADVFSVTDDMILSQSETTYDDASNATQTTVRQRYHNAPATQTGALGDPSTTPNARVSYSATYPDPLGRVIAMADYGTNGGGSFTRSATIPTPSATVLVSESTYNEAGQLEDQTDPSGKVLRTLYDAAGREIETIDNYHASVSPPSSSSGGTGCGPSTDVNRTTRFSYTADGNLKTLTAVNAATGDQTTTYEYGTTLTDSTIATSHLLRRELYPDSTGPTDSVTYSYNRQSQRTSLTDQNGTTRQFDYDALGRQTQDRVTTLGPGVDGAVRRVAWTYDVRGQVSEITCYDNATVGSGTVVNQISRSFDDFANVTHTYQAQSGTVNTSTTPWVGQTFTDGSGNVLRKTKVTYPSSREISYGYGSSGSIDDEMNRVSSLTDDDSTVLAEYEYLGNASVVQQDSTEADLRYTLIDPSLTNDPDTGDIYSGLDRFGRVKDVRWRDVSASTDLARIEYGYDRAGNRTWRENPSDPNREHDWLYQYDGLHR